jgi:hypothetical protein
LSQGKNFFELRDAVSAKGYPVSRDLVIVYLLANLLKHGNPKHGAKLFVKRPDLFRRMLDVLHPSIEWFDEINLSDDHVAEIFEIIAASGPKIDSVPRDS